MAFRSVLRLLSCSGALVIPTNGLSRRVRVSKCRLGTRPLGHPVNRLYRCTSALSNSAAWLDGIRRRVHVTNTTTPCDTAPWAPVQSKIEALVRYASCPNGVSFCFSTSGRTTCFQQLLRELQGVPPPLYSRYCVQLNAARAPLGQPCAHPFCWSVFAQHYRLSLCVGTKRPPPGALTRCSQGRSRRRRAVRRDGV
jgi:hypothetical protein